MVTTHTTTYEIVIGNKATVEATLKNYESSKEAHSLRVLGFWYDGTTNYHVLVRFNVQ